MTQNIYDNAAFFEGYSRLPRSIEGLDGAPEWPALQALLPPVQGRRVLDLGCGYGWFCRWAQAQGAADVLGIDVSERMLARAAELTISQAITYRRADLERLSLDADSYDLVYSALAFHYVEGLERLFAQIGGALVAGGALVVSVEHPIYTAPSDPRWMNAEGKPLWALDRYLDEGPRSTDWLAKGVIKQHRTIGTYVGLVLRAGLTISHLEEWGPTTEQIAAHPDWSNERERPPFLLMAARK